MDKNAIKKFAVWARTELIARVSLKGVEYGITEESGQWAVGSGQWIVDSVNGKVLTNDEKKQRVALLVQIKEKGYKEVMEEVAYTWFNRFSALRFMEVNGYLPSHVRVFTDEENNFKPQIITEAIHLDLDGLDMEKVYELKEAEKTEELYKYLLIVQCNALNKILPGMFQKIADYTELLLPDNLLRDGSVIQQMIELIPEDDWKDAVQIIGWLYQYYNSEKKDDVFAALKRNVKITKENIPAATQLFTPDWIVRYMVENSLGRIFISGQLSVVSCQWAVGSDQGSVDSEKWSEIEQERIAKEKEIAEKMGWKYYLPEAEQTPEVRAKINEQLADKLTTDHYALDTLKVIDPCSGSGHILAYMFDVLMKIYESYGYTTREAVASIVENNIYGLDIDDRAAQLAYFAVMMKARQYDRRFFSRGIQPHVYAIVESNHVDKFAVEYFCNGDAKLKAAMDTIISELHDAKEYGSILTVTQQDWSALYDRFAEITEDIHMSRDVALNELLPLVQVAEALAQKYGVVITNPPYMGSNNMSPKLNSYIKQKFPDSKSDIFAVFIEKCGKMVMKNGYQAMITQQGWMFVTSFEKLRETLFIKDLTSMVHLGSRAFDEISGEVVQTTSFVFANYHIPNYKGVYARLISGNSEQEKDRMFLDKKYRYYSKTDDFEQLPGKPFAYWVGNGFMDAFRKFPRLGDFVECAAGISTGDNDKYLKLWTEVNYNTIAKNVVSDDEFKKSSFKYAYCNKGGGFRKWYGNNEYVADWKNSNSFHRNGATYRHLLFVEGITWSEICMGNFGARYYPNGQIFDHKSPGVFTNTHEKLMDYIGFLNSKVVAYILGVINPTISTGADSLRKIPLAENNLEETYVAKIAEKQIEISKNDWDSFETSWDFQRHPLVSVQRSVDSDQKTDHCSLISDHYKAWEQQCDQRFAQLKTNEEELNRIFIDIYGLQDELTPEVEDKDVTVRKADLGRDIRSFISYAVGCMFGRYSLDVDGLAYAGGMFSCQWVVVSGQYYKREAVEYYVGKELSRAFGMAEIYVSSGGNIPIGENASERGAICLIGSDEEGGSIDSIQYRRGSSKKLYEGIYTISLDCKGLNGGTGNTIYDLCSPEILDAISNGSGNELVERGWNDAERIDWKAIHCSLTTDHFTPDKDNIIPICDDEYFEDDIVGLFVEFVKTVYGTETLDENLKFIADALGGKGQPKDVIRNYFINDFYSDHCKIYQKRPIYWLFDSGKKNGFKALIYMHRYQPDTIARIRTDYVHEQQARYRTAIADLEQRIANASTGERVKLNKKLTALQAQDAEIRTYEEKIHHLADQMISIDLDDGVKKNYAIFQDVLAEIK